MDIDGEIFVPRILFIRSLRISPFFPLSIECTLLIVFPVSVSAVSAKTVTLRYFTSLKLLSTLVQKWWAFRGILIYCRFLTHIMRERAPSATIFANTQNWNNSDAISGEEVKLPGTAWLGCLSFVLSLHMLLVCFSFFATWTMNQWTFSSPLSM